MDIAINFSFLFNLQNYLYNKFFILLRINYLNYYLIYKIYELYKFLFTIIRAKLDWSIE